MEIKKICVMADITRCADGKDGIIKWLGGLMEGIIARICDIPFYTFYNDELKKLHLELYKAYGIDLSNNNVENYDFLSVPVENWIDISFAEPNEKVLEIVKDFFYNSLVITREPAFILKKAFEILEIPYIDLAVHPIRYLDDIIMGITSNIPSIYKKCKDYEINKEEFYFYADLLKAEYQFKSGFPDHITKSSNYALFFAQTPVDRSLLDFEKKKLVSFFDFEEQFVKLTKEHEIVHYKSHPFYENNEIINFIKSFKNVRILNDLNTYHLLSLPGYKTCASISSGTLKEAYYFGKKIQYFHKPPYQYSEDFDKNTLDKNIYITIGKHWLTSAFWADILSPIIETKPVHKINIDNIHNKFRRILNTSWGFNDSDSIYIKKELEQLRKEH